MCIVKLERVVPFSCSLVLYEMQQIIDMYTIKFIY